MSEFYAPQFQQPDILGQYIRGQQAGVQQQLMPYRLQSAQLGVQQQQQGIEQGQLNLQQLRMALQFGSLRNQIIGQALQEQSGGAPTAGTAPAGASEAVRATGGIQNGPQATVATGPTMPSSNTLSGNYSVPGWEGGVNIQSPHISPNTIQALALVDPEMVKGITEGQTAQLNAARLQARQPGGTLPLLDALAGDPNADRTLMSNPQLMPYWPQIAGKYGVDPREMTAINVRRVATMVANEQHARLQEPLLSMPTHYTQKDVGYGGNVNINDNTGEQTPGEPREIPSVSYERTTDPNDPEKTILQPVVTRGLSANTPAMGPGGGSAAAPVSLGYTATPTTDQTRAAGLALTMRSGLNGMRQQEANGLHLTASDRATIVGVISENGSGPLGFVTGDAMASLPLQELLAHKLSPEAQTYLASLMPVLQGIGHHLGGVRLSDTMIKSLLESVAPINTDNKSAMQQINANREGYYAGVLGEVGGAARGMGPYKGKLDTDWQRMQNPSDPYGQFLAGAGQAPQPGYISKGYRFKGGDPSKQENWEKSGG